jgi:hypothetical protein
MGLKLSISAEEEKNSFIVYDCTGRYSYDNKGGWGAPNAEIKKITSAVIYVTPPNLSPSVLPYSIDVTGNFPNTEGNGMEILPYQVGQANNKLISGKYLIKLEVKGTDVKGVEYTTSAILSEIFIKSVSCCIDKLQKTVNRDAYKDKKQMGAIDLNLLLMSAEWAIGCKLQEQAVETIEFLNSQCTCVDC